MAPLMAMDPSLVAGTAARLPLNEPNGVRTALTITTSCAGGGRKKKGKTLIYSANFQTNENTDSRFNFFSFFHFQQVTYIERRASCVASWQILVSLHWGKHRAAVKTTFDSSVSHCALTVTTVRWWIARAAPYVASKSWLQGILVLNVAYERGRRGGQVSDVNMESWMRSRALHTVGVHLHQS